MNFTSIQCRGGGKYYPSNLTVRRKTKFLKQQICANTVLDGVSLKTVQNFTVKSQVTGKAVQTLYVG